MDRAKILRKELDGWREILVGLHSILIWDQQYYPAVIFAVVSFVFLFIGYIDPAILTFLSFIGILVTLSDYLVPKVTTLIFDANQWTGAQERKYVEIVNTLAGAFDSFIRVGSSIKSAKATRPKTYFIAVTSILILCAWIGSSVDNLFLTYLIVLTICLFPGLRRKDIVRKNFAVLMQRVSSVLQPSSTTNKLEETEIRKETKKE